MRPGIIGDIIRTLTSRTLAKSNSNSVYNSNTHKVPFIILKFWFHSKHFMICEIQRHLHCKEVLSVVQLLVTNLISNALKVRSVIWWNSA